MGYLRHVRALNTFDGRGFAPLFVDGTRYGWVRPAFAEALKAWPDAFHVGHERVEMAPGLADPDARTEALAPIVEALSAAGLIGPPRAEPYVVANRWGDTPAMTVDRAAMAGFGFKSYGVHVNGFVRDGDDLKLWIGRRGPDREVAPGQLDNMIAGGQPAGLSLAENLIKEAHEEASVPEDLARRARPVGAVSYKTVVDGGVKDDCMFCFDLEVPADFTPTPNDDEVDAFMLMDVAEALRAVRDTDDVKFNVNLVILDFAIRHGALSPDDLPEYEALCEGLRGG